MKVFYNIHFVWAVMLLLTFLAYFVGELGSGGFYTTLFLLLVVMLKGMLIINEFMALRDVSFLWRAIMVGWLIVVCAGIALAYTMSL